MHAFMNQLLCKGPEFEPVPACAEHPELYPMGVAWKRALRAVEAEGLVKLGTVPEKLTSDLYVLESGFKRRPAGTYRLRERKSPSQQAKLTRCPVPVNIKKIKSCPKPHSREMREAVAAWYQECGMKLPELGSAASAKPPLHASNVGAIWSSTPEDWDED